VFENKVLRRIFGPKRDEVTKEVIKIHNEEVHDLYSSPNVILLIKKRRMRWARHIECMVEWRGAYRVFLGTPEGKESTWKIQV
jgi:hypothetical protein